MARDIYIRPDTGAHKSFLLWALLRRKELALSGEEQSPESRLEAQVSQQGVE